MLLSVSWRSLIDLLVWKISATTLAKDSDDAFADATCACSTFLISSPTKLSDSADFVASSAIA